MHSTTTVLDSLARSIPQQFDLGPYHFESTVWVMTRTYAITCSLDSRCMLGILMACFTMCVEFVLANRHAVFCLVWWLKHGNDTSIMFVTLCLRSEILPRPIWVAGSFGACIGTWSCKNIFYTHVHYACLVTLWHHVIPTMARPCKDLYGYMTV